MELNLDTYALILARLACRRGARVEDVLSEMGIEREAFRVAEAGFREDLAAAWPNRKGIAAMKFATVLGNELARLGALSGDGAPPPERASGDEPPLPPLTTAARSREPDVPTFLQPAAAPRTAFTPPEAFPPPLIVPAHVAPEPAPKPSIAGTADMDLSAIVAAVKRGSLPFNPSEVSAAISAPEPSVRPPVEVPAGAHIGETMNSDMSAIVSAVKRGALPFGASDPGGTPSAVDVEFAELPLETYARVTGALARGESREEALARHHVRPDVFDRGAKAWALRFQREPHLLTRFQELARSAASPRRVE